MAAKKLEPEARNPFKPSSYTVERPQEPEEAPASPEVRAAARRRIAQITRASGTFSPKQDDSAGFERGRLWRWNMKQITVDLFSFDPAFMRRLQLEGIIEGRWLIPIGQRQPRTERIPGEDDE